MKQARILEWYNTFIHEKAHAKVFDYFHIPVRIDLDEGYVEPLKDTCLFVYLLSSLIVVPLSLLLALYWRKKPFASQFGLTYTDHLRAVSKTIKTFIANSPFTLRHESLALLDWFLHDR